MEDLKEFSQGAGEALIDERDRYIAEKIMQSKTEEKMLVVVGAGHLKGIERALNPYNPLSTEEFESISTVPKKGIVGKVLPFAIPLIVMALVGFALFNNNEVDYVKMLTVWTLFNAIFAAIGCILARGHPLAILTAALASPITSLNPALAAGWFAGTYNCAYQNRQRKICNNSSKEHPLEDFGATEQVVCFSLLL